METRTYHRFHPDRAPAGSIVVRLFRTHGTIMATVRRVDPPGEDLTYRSEEVPPDEAFALAENKQTVEKTGDIFIELDNIEWQDEWGRLRD